MTGGSAAWYGWAFLVARGRRAGYRTLLVPDFLAESNEYGVLSEAATGDPASADASSTATVTGLAAGDITLAYRTERLTYALAGDAISSNTGRARDDLVMDQHGRPLDLLYGFVCRAPGLLDVDAADFSPAHEEALRVYRRFLADETGFQPENSHAYLLRSTASDHPDPAAERASEKVQPPPPQAPFRSSVADSRRRPTRWLVPLAGLGLVAVSGVAWFAIVGGSDEGSVTYVHVEKLSEGPVDCDSPVEVRGTIKTNGPATVDYHWESDTGTTGSAQVEFIEAGEQSIVNQVRLQGAPGQQVQGTQTLIIDGPNSRKASSTYKLTCQ